MPRTTLERISGHRRAGGTVTVTSHRRGVTRVLERRGAVPVNSSHGGELQFAPL